MIPLLPHRHAAIFACLLCMKFDYSNNIIIPGSLQLDDFEKAQIPYYKNPGITPRQQLALIRAPLGARAYP
jgi:hypothetical protein